MNHSKNEASEQKKATQNKPERSLNLDMETKHKAH